MLKQNSILSIIALLMCLSYCGCADLKDQIGSPEKVKNPQPTPGAVDVPITVNLSWGAAARAEAYVIYFGTNELSVAIANTTMAEFKGCQTTLYFDPIESGNLDYSTTYYWRIDTMNGSIVTTSNVFSFTTEDTPAMISNQVTNPDPADGAIDVPEDKMLSWAAAIRAESYDIYFGTNLLSVTNATKLSPEYIGNQTDLTCDPLISFVDNATKYWRVDSVNLFGITKGTLWTFSYEFPWNTPENISNSGVLAGYGSLAVDSSDKIHLVYNDQVFPITNIAYTSLASDSSWTTPLNISVDATNLNYVATIAIDNLNTLHVTYYKQLGTNYGIYYTNSTDNISWTAPEEVVAVTAVAQYPEVATDDTNVAHIVYYSDASGSDQVYYTNCSTGSWSVPVNISQSAQWARSPRIAIDTSGTIHVVWYDYRDGQEEIYYTANSGGGWSAEINLSNNLEWSGWPSIAVSSNGNIHIIWSNGDVTGRLLYRVLSDGSWGDAEVAHTSTGYAYRADIACYPSTNNPYIVWHDDELGYNEIMCTWKDSSGWRTPYNLSNSTSSSGHAKTIVDSSGRVHVVWQDVRTGKWEVFYTTSK